MSHKGWYQCGMEIFEYDVTTWANTTSRVLRGGDPTRWFLGSVLHHPHVSQHAPARQDYSTS
ncbi:hypothetical protein J6590_031860 [Homalodisca vitripennis]|nr:hypothetical protein J6590_031860 [Homalodisca vitripennis]